MSNRLLTHVERMKLAEQVKQYYWWHSIDLGGGIVTPGHKTPEIHSIESAAIFDPIKIDGASVLDIGAWNGFYSFEAKRRGAGRVMAVDHITWNEERFHGREAFDLARSALGLDVETLDSDVMDLSAEKVGGAFDVVLFLGVLYHLADPIKGLELVASLTKQVLVIETHIDLEEVSRPAMVMYPGGELGDDPSNWWGPNRACVKALLGMVGFNRIEERVTLPPARWVFHAWR